MFWIMQQESGFSWAILKARFHKIAMGRRQPYSFLWHAPDLMETSSCELTDHRWRLQRSWTEFTFLCRYDSCDLMDTCVADDRRPLFILPGHVHIVPKKDDSMSQECHQIIKTILHWLCTAPWCALSELSTDYLRSSATLVVLWRQVLALQVLALRPPMVGELAREQSLTVADRLRFYGNQHLWTFR